jgi:hypothetical protein
MQYGVRYDSPTIMKGDLFLEACDKLNTVGWFVNSFISSNNVEVESFFFCIRPGHILIQKNLHELHKRFYV